VKQSFYAGCPSSEETGWGEGRTSPQRPGRATGTVAGGVAFFGAASASISSSLGKRREPGVEAKLCELDDKAFGPDVL
jgi:hypothetical protein